METFKVSINVIMILLLCSCSTTGTTTSNTVPAPIIPSEYERQIMREHIPVFYIKFTNQQLDLKAAR